MLLQAALSDLDIEFIDGPYGKDVVDKAVPLGPDDGRPPDGVLGCWRAHMNAIHEIVKRNISSALIMEDDTDWDVRIKQQMQHFAMSTQALLQPLAGSPGYADPTYPVPAENSPGRVPDLDFRNLPATVEPVSSPYGDGWDLLWVGNCGMSFPNGGNPKLPRGRVVYENDITVPDKRYLWSFTDPFSLKDEYPEHTRVVHHAQDGVCALGYAVSQSGARKLLHELALKGVSDGLDILMRFFCDSGKGRSHHNCLAVQPGFFHHHRPPGRISSESDIGDHGDGYRDKGNTDMVKWSVRLNADRLLEGETEMWDALPNGG
jgi:hypothetical protein